MGCEGGVTIYDAEAIEAEFGPNDFSEAQAGETDHPDCRVTRLRVARAVRAVGSVETWT